MVDFLTRYAWRLPLWGRVTASRAPFLIQRRTVVSSTRRRRATSRTVNSSSICSAIRVSPTMVCNGESFIIVVSLCGMYSYFLLLFVLFDLTWLPILSPPLVTCPRQGEGSRKGRQKIDRRRWDSALTCLVLHIVTLFSSSVIYTILFGTNVLK